MNSQDFRNSLFLGARRKLAEAGSASTFGHLCVDAIKVFKWRKRGIPALASVDLQPELQQSESRLLGMERRLLFCLSNSFT